MANNKRTLFLKRRMRVRNKLRKINAGLPRLSVHRSNKNISVQLIDDVQGVTLALRVEPGEGSRRCWSEQCGSSCQGGHSHCRARQEGGRRGGSVRPRRFPLPRQDQSAGRCGPRGWSESLMRKGPFAAPSMIRGRTRAHRDWQKTRADARTKIGAHMAREPNNRGSRRDRDEAQSLPTVWSPSTGCPRPPRVVRTSASQPLSSSATRKAASALAKVKPKKCLRRSAKQPSKPSAR